MIWVDLFRAIVIRFRNWARLFEGGPKTLFRFLFYFVPCVHAECTGHFFVVVGSFYFISSVGESRKATVLSHGTDVVRRRVWSPK